MCALWRRRAVIGCVGTSWGQSEKLTQLKREHGDDSSREALKDCSFFPIYCFCFEASVPSNCTIVNGY
ncbi:hypothetical protein OWV82_017558 [Melia azedarach]|uniref:Uncharacterized protein n=1 Tax=Melia azedarach TaxID=155640 RepID=A0ACC1XKV2_MELAZ|nr:hypothetical protein OWV82_017558 [Melia azedarach]